MLCQSAPCRSHPARGAWIEIDGRQRPLAHDDRRTPQGVRGLKSKRHGWTLARSPSHPARGAWIEIECPCLQCPGEICRTPQGVRGLKWHAEPENAGCAGRTPQGVRGLKFILPPFQRHTLESHPARGAWIEIPLIASAAVIASSRTPQGVRGLKFRG